MNTNQPKHQISPVSWVPTVYFAMGLPFVVLNMVPALMFLEMFKTKKFFVVLTQFCSGIFFGLVALSLQLPNFFAVSIALLAVIAFSGATHDVATDGVYMAVLDKDDQAKYIGWQGAFYNVAKLAATGGLVYLAGCVQAWMLIMGCCGAIMLLLGLYHWKMLPSDKAVSENRVTSAADTWNALKDVILTFFQKKYIALYILFIILYRFAEGLVMKIVPLFLKAPLADGGLGLTEQQIGLYYGSFGAAAFVLGSFMAGYYISHSGLKKTLFTLCCVFNFPFVVYPLLALYQPDSPWLIGGAITFEYFGYGFGFVGLTLFMMQQVAPGKHQMAHYAFASGIMNLGVMIPGMISGFLSDWLGYAQYFIVVLFAAIPVLILVRFLPFTYPDEKK